WTFRESEPLTSWVIVLAGPASTLPATLLAIRSRRWGAAWLIAGVAVSLATVVLADALYHESLAVIARSASRYTTVVDGPMILLGAGLLWARRRLDRRGG